VARSKNLFLLPRSYLSGAFLIYQYVYLFIDKLDNLRGGNRTKILITIAGGWSLTIGGRMIYPVLLPHLRTTYELDLAVAGSLLTILFLAYALGQLPGGVLTDRIGEKRTLTLSLLIASGALILVITAGSSLTLFIATSIFGIGIGLFAIPRFTALVGIYPENYGTAIGITNSSSEIGQGLLPPIAGFIAIVVGWQYGFAFLIPLFVIIAVTLWLTMPNSSPNETYLLDTLCLTTVRRMLSELYTPPIVSGTVIFILGMSIWQSLTGFYPMYLVEIKGMSATVASMIFGLYFVINAFIHPISGAIYDRWNIKYTFLIVLVSVIGFILLPLVEGVWQLIMVTILLGPFLGFSTATESYLVNELPSDMEGTGFGVLRTISFAVGAMGPFFFGIAAGWGFFNEVFLSLALFALVIVLLGIRLPDRTV